jgi:hypothetical protein
MYSDRESSQSNSARHTREGVVDQPLPYPERFPRCSTSDSRRLYHLAKADAGRHVLPYDPGVDERDDREALEAEFQQWATDIVARQAQIEASLEGIAQVYLKDSPHSVVRHLIRRTPFGSDTWQDFLRAVIKREEVTLVSYNPDFGEHDYLALPRDFHRHARIRNDLAHNSAYPQFTHPDAHLMRTLSDWDRLNSYCVGWSFEDYGRPLGSRLKVLPALINRIQMASETEFSLSVEYRIDCLSYHFGVLQVYDSPHEPADTGPGIKRQGQAEGDSWGEGVWP